MRLNDAIAADDSLGEGFRIGHSYLCNLDAESGSADKLSVVVEYELVPMLKEYWFDDADKVAHWSRELRRSIK